MKLRYIYIFLLALYATCAYAADKLETEVPDFDKIKAESIDENSKFYYPKLLRMYMSNDTVMTPEDYKYLYYGTMFQEDYDPYRAPYDEEKLKELTPLYYKTTHTRAERDQIQKYAQKAIEDNPLDLVQLKNLIFVYEQNKKVNLAKIWKNKLNNLLRTIASSGTGLDPENAWYVVFPRHEFDFLNITGITVQNKDFMEPYYERFEVNRKSEKDPEAYYFNLRPVLDQYYLKHPSEAMESDEEAIEEIEEIEEAEE